MVSMNTSVDKGEQSLPQPSELAVAVPSIQIGEQSYSKETALEVALVLLECVCHQMLSPDAMAIAFMTASKRMPEHVELIVALHGMANRIWKSNELSGIFGWEGGDQ